MDDTVDYEASIEAHEDMTLSITIRAHYEDIYDALRSLGTEDGIVELFERFAEATGIPF